MIINKRQSNTIPVDIFKRNMFGSIDGLCDEDIKSFVTTNSIRRFFEDIVFYKYIIGEKGDGKSALYNYLDITPPSSDTIVFSLPIDVYISADDFLGNAPTRSYVSANLINQIIWGIFQNLCDEERLHIIDCLTESKIFIDGVNDYKKQEDEYSVELALKPIVNFTARTKISYVNNDTMLNSCFIKLVGVICSYLETFDKRLLLLFDNLDNFIDSMRKKNYQFDEDSFLLDIFGFTMMTTRYSKSLIDCKLFLRTDLYNPKFFRSNADKEEFLILNLNWNKDEIVELIGKKLLLTESIKNLYVNHLNGHTRKKMFSRSNDVLKEVSYEKVVAFFIPQNLSLESASIEILPFNEWVVQKFSNCKNVINPRIIVAFLGLLGEAQREIYEKQGKECISIDDDVCPLFSDCVFENSYSLVKSYEYKRIVSILNKDEIEAMNIILLTDENGTINIERLITCQHSFPKSVLDKLSGLGVIKRITPGIYELEKLLVDYNPM